MTELRNYTPHSITVYDAHLNVINTFPSVGSIRLTEDKPEIIDYIDNIPIHKPYKYSGLESLSCLNNIIVSAMVGEEIAKDTSGVYFNVFSPDMGRDCVRNESGQIIGTKSFIRWC